MFDRSLRDLNLAGWCLAVVALGATVLVSIPIGRWVLNSIPSETFREWGRLLVVLLAIPGIFTAVLVFLGGERLLARCGIRVRRRGMGEATETPPAEGEEDRRMGPTDEKGDG